MNYLSPRTHFSDYCYPPLNLPASSIPSSPSISAFLTLLSLFGFGFFWDSLSIMTITVNYALLELFPRIWRAPSWHTGKDNSCWSPRIHQEQGQFIRERESSETPQAMTVEAQPCTGLLQAAQLSQVMAALAELCQEPSISQPFSRGHILPRSYILPAPS